MFFRNKPVLLPAGTDLCTDSTRELDFALADMVEACFAPPVMDRTEMAYEENRYHSPLALRRARLITKGQWLLLVVNELDGQILNGGISQFFQNWPAWIDEVVEVLEELQMWDFREAYIDTIKLANPVFDSFKPSQGTSLLSEMRDLDRLGRELRNAIGDGQIDENFMRRYDNGRNGDWDDDQWSQQIKKRMIAWVADHPGEFRKER